MDMGVATAQASVAAVTERDVHAAWTLTQNDLVAHEAVRT
jgi:hypothetical protein